jgi:hypothetical protein
MARMSMGTNDVSAKEAAEILGVSTARVYQMKRSGRLRSVGRLTQDIRFSREEVCALAEAREDGYPRLDELQEQLIQSRAHIRMLERRLEGLERMMGLRSRLVGRNEVEVLGLYFKAQDAVKEPTVDVIDTREWREVFLGIHEEFFDLVESYTGDPEPWRVFVTLAKKVHENAPPLGELYDEELVATKAELEVARRNVRAAAWMYLYHRRGRAFAEAEFPDTDPDPITHLLNNHVLVLAHP